MELKVFQTIETNFIRMGFIAKHSVPERLLNVTIFMGFIVLALSTTSECILLKQANTFELYVESIYVTSATIMFVIIYTSTVFKIPHFYQFVNTYQRVVNASK